MEWLFWLAASVLVAPARPAAAPAQRLATSQETEGGSGGLVPVITVRVDAAPSLYEKLSAALERWWRRA